MWRWQLKTCWSLLTDLIDVPPQNLLRLALLLMLMMKIVLATVCCILGSWGLVIKPNFCSDFQHEVEVQAGFLSWSLINILLLMFCRGYEDESWLRCWSKVWSIFWILSLVEVVMFGVDFEVNAWSRFWRWSLNKICVWTCDMTQ